MTWRSIAVTTVLALNAACASGGQATRENPAVRGYDYTLEVRNQNFNAVTVYLYRLGARERMGVVEGNSTQTYNFDYPATEVRILMSFLAGGCVLTEELPLVEGDDLLLIVRSGDDRRATRAACR
jgi:hypothetical protein